MPAYLRQELEDTIVSLKSQVHFYYLSTALGGWIKTILSTQEIMAIYSLANILNKFQNRVMAVLPCFKSYPPLSSP